MNSQAATLGNVMRRDDEVADMQTGDRDVLQRESLVAERDQDIRRVCRTLHRMGGQPAIDIVGAHFGKQPQIDAVLARREIRNRIGAQVLSRRKNELIGARTAGQRTVDAGSENNVLAGCAGQRHRPLSGLVDKMDWYRNGEAIRYLPSPCRFAVDCCQDRNECRCSAWR